MKHFSTEEWIDFVNRVIPATKQAEMRGHLDSGCKRCAQTVGFWQRVHQGAKTEAVYQPPDGAVRSAKALLEANREAKSPSAIRLLFDSFLQPALAGVRSTETEARQLLYAYGPFLLHLQVSLKQETNQVSIMGQVLNSKSPDQALSGVSVVLTNRHGDAVLFTNRFGEFQSQVDFSDDLEVRLPTLHGKDIVILLRDLLPKPGRERP